MCPEYMAESRIQSSRTPSDHRSTPSSDAAVPAHSVRSPASTGRSAVRSRFPARFVEGGTIATSVRCVWGCRNVSGNQLSTDSRLRSEVRRLALKRAHEGPQTAFGIAGAVLAVSVGLVDWRVHDRTAAFDGALVVGVDVVDDHRHRRGRCPDCARGRLTW